MEGYNGRSIGQSYDWKLVILYLLLVFIGWINIYASIHGNDVSGIFDFSANSGKQFIWMLTSFGLGGLIMFVISPNLWDSGAFVLYFIVIGLLVAVIFLGVEVKGSRSWFAFGPVRFQPAEVSKITTSAGFRNEPFGIQNHQVKGFHHSSSAVGSANADYPGRE